LPIENNKSRLKTKHEANTQKQKNTKSDLDRKADLDRKKNIKKILINEQDMRKGCSFSMLCRSNLYRISKGNFSTIVGGESKAIILAKRKKAGKYKLQEFFSTKK
jgi:hypothetical protein